MSVTFPFILKKLHLRHCVCIEEFVSEFPNASSSSAYIAFLPFFFQFLEEKKIPFLTIPGAVVWVASLLAELESTPLSKHTYTWFSWTRDPTGSAFYQ